MKNVATAFRLSALTLAVLAAHGPARASDEAMAALTKPDSELSVGLGSWSNDRPQMGIYDGQREAGLYPLFSLDLNRRDDTDASWFKFKVQNYGVEDIDFRAEYLKQGDIGFSFDWQTLTRTSPYTVRTGLQGAGTASQVLSGNGAAALPKYDLSLSTSRDIATFAFTKSLSTELEALASFRHEEKFGSRHWGMGSQPYFLSEPIDYTTRIFDLTLNYTGERLQLSGGYSASYFENANPLVSARINGAAQPGTTGSPNPTPLTTPLDNAAQQFFLNGGYAFAPHTRGTFKLSYTRATQDEYLPTWGLPAPNARFTPMPASLDSRIDTTLVQLGLTSRPMPKLAVVASLQYKDVADKTPVVGVVGNNTTGAVTVHNTPHSIQSNNARVEATYQLPERVSATAGAEFNRQDRSYPLYPAERFVPFREKVDETTLKLELRRSLADSVNGRIALLKSDRNGSAYLATENFPSDLITPLHIADRDRTKVRLAVDWMPVEALSLQAMLEGSNDKYDTPTNRPYGLRDGKATLFSIDASYRLNDDWNLNAWFSHDTTTADITGARWDLVTETYELDRSYKLQDTGDSVGIGARGKVAAKTRIGADFQWTHNQSEYDDQLTTNGPGAALTPPPAVAGGTTARITTALPDIKNNTTRIAFFALVEVEKRSEVRFDYVYERWETNDWTWQNGAGTPFLYGGTAGTAVDGSTVLTEHTQHSSFFGLRYIHRFR